MFRLQPLICWGRFDSTLFAMLLFKTFGFFALSLYPFSICPIFASPIPPVSIEISKVWSLLSICLRCFMCFVLRTTLVHLGFLAHAWVLPGLDTSQYSLEVQSRTQQSFCPIPIVRCAYHEPWFYKKFIVWFIPYEIQLLDFVINSGPSRQ